MKKLAEDIDEVKEPEEKEVIKTNSNLMPIVFTILLIAILGAIAYYNNKENA